MYYASFGMLAIIIHIIINIDVIRGCRNDTESLERSRYRAFLLGILLYYLSDVLWGLLSDLKIVPLIYADTVLYFVAMGLSLFLWMRFTVAYLNQNNHLTKILLIAGSGFFLFEIIVLIVNFFVPIMFSIHMDGSYEPGIARYITLGIQVMLFTIVSVYSFICSMRADEREKIHHRSIGISGLVMLIFIIVQTYYPLLPFYAIGCLIANCVIHTFVGVDERVDYDQTLGSVRKIAYKDPLTHVRNANAYTEAKIRYDELIRAKELTELGVIVFDLNNLKSVNDTLGHEAGDKYIQTSCKMICNVFKRSPVFRIGGDEFVVLLEGEDYLNREALFDAFVDQVVHNIRNGGPVVAGGMAVYEADNDSGYYEIFERADSQMYAHKKKLKGERA